MALNFPLTRENGDPLQSGDQYTGDNGITYVYDGVKWVGQSSTLPQGSSSLVNNGRTLQLDTAGNIRGPFYVFTHNTGTTGQVLTWPGSGNTLTWATPVVTASATTSTLINGSYKATLTNVGNLLVPGAINNVYLSNDFGATISSGNTATAVQIFSGNIAGPYGGEIDLGWNGVYLYTGNENNLWIFDNDGVLTLPTGGDIKDNIGNSLITDVRSSIVNGAYTATINTTGQLVLPVSTSGSARIESTSSISLYSNYNNWQFGSNGILTLPNTGTIRTTDLGGTEVRNTKGVVFSSRDGNSVAIDDTNGLIVTTGVSNTWTFGTTGTIILPIGGDIVDSYGQTVLGFEASYSSGYTVLDSSPGGITVTGDVTNVFTTGTIIKFSILADDEYTIGETSYDIGNDWTDIGLVEGLGGPVNGDSILFEVSGVNEIYPSDTVSLTLNNNILTLGVTGIYSPSNSEDWEGPAPTTLAEAIDRLAAAVKAINSTGA